MDSRLLPRYARYAGGDLAEPLLLTRCFSLRGHDIAVGNLPDHYLFNCIQLPALLKTLLIARKAGYILVAQHVNPNLARMAGDI
jgi:hypothetical protein